MASSLKLWPHGAYPWSPAPANDPRLAFGSGDKDTDENGKMCRWNRH